MAVLPRFDQLQGEVIEVGGWEPDDEFPYLPLGQKPKRVLICPSPAPRRYLIGGHRYLFKEPRGRAAQQIWAEVVAYKLAREVLVEVPPAFVAYDTATVSCGVLVEYFFGCSDRQHMRFVHARDRFQAFGLELNEKRGSLHDNLLLSRLHRVPDVRSWWAQTVALDTLTGNTDRHSENWGFLVRLGEDGEPLHELAPAFDNGSSLGCVIRDADLADYLRPEKLQRFIERGTHHYGWLSWDGASARHTQLCAHFLAKNRSTAPTMARIATISDAQVEAILSFCAGFDFPIQFSQQRGEFAFAQIRGRRAALARALGDEMTRWIEHLVEPARLVLAWRPPLHVEDRLHWAVGELRSTADGDEFRYFSGPELAALNNGRPAEQLRASGFRGYPAFKWAPDTSTVFRNGALGAFERRLLSPHRTDFAAYLARFHLRPDQHLSAFALLSTTSASLPNDGFSLIDPLDGDVEQQDLVLEVHGYRHHAKTAGALELGSPAILVPEPRNSYDEFAVRVEVTGHLIGYVSRLQSRSVSRWLHRREVEATLVRVNGSQVVPRAFIFVAVRARALHPA